MENSFVFSHDDLHTSNILIDQNKEIWFNDFEYTLSSSMYLDIEKFFRFNEKLNMYRTKTVYNRFYEGYNKYAKCSLPENWIENAMIYDMTGMLSLINNKKPNQKWIKEIERGLKHTVLLIEKNN